MINFLHRGYNYHTETLKIKKGKPLKLGKGIVLNFRVSLKADNAIDVSRILLVKLKRVECRGDGRILKMRN